MSYKSRLCCLIVILGCVGLSSTQAQAVTINGKINDGQKDGIVVEGFEQLMSFQTQQLLDDPTYKPIQNHLPKPTHQYAAAETCTLNGTAANQCNPLTCTNSQGNNGSLRLLMTAPLDEDLPQSGLVIGYNQQEILNAWQPYRQGASTYCSADEPLAAGQVLSEALDFGVEDLKDYGLVASQVHGPKNNGLTLVQYNTNIWVDPQDQVMVTELLGVPVRARAVPEEFVFDYGDGSPLVVRDVPGYFLGDDQWDVETSTSHVYERTGVFEANVMTVFGAELSVNGGGWFPLVGRAEVWGDAVPVDVWRTDVFLVGSEGVVGGS